MLVSAERADRKKSPREADLRVALIHTSGTFVVYDASGAVDDAGVPLDSNTPLPPRERGRGEGSSAERVVLPHGFLAYWADYRTGQFSVYGRRLFNQDDVAHALRNLQRDLDVDLAPLLELDPDLARALQRTQAEPENQTPWRTGLAAINEMLRPASPGNTPEGGTVAAVGGGVGDSGHCLTLPEDRLHCDYWVWGGAPRRRIPGRAPFAMSDEDTIGFILRISGCHATGGGGCVGPCCGSLDPCCDGEDPCCVNPCLCLDCNDGNACTTDGCSGGACHHAPVTCPSCSECSPSSGCGPPDCNDHNACTTDGCSGGACYHVSVNCGPCVACNPSSGCGGANCNDFDACTTDVCVGGQCQNPSNCDDGNACTNDYCVNGECQHAPRQCDSCEVCIPEQCASGFCCLAGCMCNGDSGPFGIQVPASECGACAAFPAYAGPACTVVSKCYRRDALPYLPADGGAVTIGGFTNCESCDTGCPQSSPPPLTCQSNFENCYTGTVEMNISPSVTLGIGAVQAALTGELGFSNEQQVCLGGGCSVTPPSCQWATIDHHFYVRTNRVASMAHEWTWYNLHTADSSPSCNCVSWNRGCPLTGESRATGSGPISVIFCGLESFGTCSPNPPWQGPNP